MNELEKLKTAHNWIIQNDLQVSINKRNPDAHAKESILFAIEELENIIQEYDGEIDLWIMNRLINRINELKKLIE